MLEANSVLVCSPELDDPIFEGYIRFLAVSESRVACVIRLDTRTIRNPYLMPFDLIENAIRANHVLINQEFKTNVPLDSSQLSKVAKEKFERNLRLVGPLLRNPELLFNKDKFLSEVSRQSHIFNVSSRTIERLFNRYLWAGQSELALAPTYHQCGGNEQEPGQSRRGPKGSSVSKVCSTDVKDKLISGANKFYFSGTHTQEAAYIATLKLFFRKGIVYEKPFGKQPTLKEILLPKDQLPTLRQFRYICEKIEAMHGKRKVLPGRIRARKDSNIIYGKDREKLLGPGHRFEIDATKIQVQLVSRYGRQHHVGTAILYIVIDVWSGAIVGYTLWLGAESWALTAMALFNCFTDKEKIFKRLGLPYGSNDWPCGELPTVLTADRGSLLSNNGVSVPHMGITLKVCPPMTPEYKVSVESKISDLKYRRNGKKLPGSFPKKRERREDDGFKTAALTIDELERVIVQSIIDFNKEPTPIQNIPHKLIQDGYTDISRIGIYTWGLENRPGYTRHMTEQEVFTHLLARDTASISNRGIYYRKCFFVSDALRSSGLQQKAANNGRMKIDIRYNEFLAESIWFLDPNSNQWVEAKNSNEEICRLGITFFELDKYFAYVSALRKEQKEQQIHEAQESAVENQKMIRNAVAEARKVRGSKGHSPKSLTHNQQLERLALKTRKGNEIRSLLEKMSNIEAENMIRTEDENVMENETNKMLEAINSRLGITNE